MSSSSCGSGDAGGRSSGGRVREGDRAVVLRVGQRAFSKSDVAHWVRVVAHGGAFEGFRGEPRGTAKRRALALLISCSWLIGEASEQGLSLSRAAVDQAFADRAPETRTQEGPGAAGETTADAEFELRAELAEEEIGKALAQRADRIAPQALVGFYRRHRSLFSTPEVRVTDLLENKPTRSAAVALVRRLGSGRGFTRVAYHEFVTHTRAFMDNADKVRLVDRIFASRPGALSAPLVVNGGWAIFVVRRVIPPHPQPFTKVRHEIARRLRVSRLRRLEPSFDRAYTARWRGRTSCEPAYVGPGCPQDRGALGPYEDPFSARAHALRSETGEGG